VNIFVIALALWLALPVQHAGAGPIDPVYLQPREPARHALVIGNARYAHQEALASASMDASAMAERLRRMHYEVLYVPNLQTVDELEEKVLPQFRPRIAPGDIVVFYFSGHGFGHGPFNYLVPGSMPATVRADELRKQAIAIDNVQTALHATRPGMMLFLIDACRTLSNLVIDVFPAPVPGIEGTSLAPVKPLHAIPKGMAGQPDPDSTTNIVTVYAASPGKVAWASSLPNAMSVFTQSFAVRMAEPGKELRAILDEVTADVRVMSGATQTPTVYRGTAADLFLQEMPPLTLDAHRQAWLASLESNSYGQISWFSYRFAASPYAAPARQWLTDHADGADDVTFTLADPLAVESAWGRQAAIRVPDNGLAFPRSVTASPEAASEVAPGEEKEGLVRRGKTLVRTTTATLVAEVKRMMARKGAVTIRDFLGRAAPSRDADTVMRLPFGTAITINGIEKRTEDGVWVSATKAGSDIPVYLNLEAVRLPVAPIDLGQSLEELRVPARGQFPYLAESAPVRDAIAGLRNAGKTVTWVSIAAPPVAEKAKLAEQQARIIHVNYLLKQAGIDARRITTVRQAADVAGEDLRLRIFGH
jgi:uncharacterized caspase-like protein